MRNIPLKFTLVLLLLTASGLAQDSPQEKAGGTGAEIQAYFKQFVEATRDKKEGAILNLMDVESFVDEVIRMADMGPLPVPRSQLTAGVRISMGVSLNAAFTNWQRFRILNSTAGDDVSTAVCLVKAWDDDGYSSQCQFWLRRHADHGWRFYDVEDLSTGMGYASMAAVGLQQMTGSPQGERLVEASRIVMESAMALAQEDLEAASAALEKVRGRIVPPAIESSRWLLEAAVSLAKLDGAAIVDALDKAIAFHPEFPVGESLYAWAANINGDPKRAIRYAESYTEKFGIDASVCQQMGLAFEELGDEQAAIQWYRKGLEESPNMTENLMLLGSLLDKEEVSEVADHFSRLLNPKTNLDYIAEGFIEYGAPEALETLALAFGKTYPKSMRALYYQALSLKMRQKHAEAYQLLFKEIVSLQAADGSDEYLSLLFQLAVETSLEIETYDAVSDKEFAVSELGELLDLAKHHERANRFREHHASEHPSDARARYRVADGFFYRDKFEEARQHFTAALELSPGEPLQEEIEYSIFLCLYKMSRYDEAYDRDPENGASLIEYLIDAEKLTEAQRYLKRFADADAAATDAIRLQNLLFLAKNEIDQSIDLLQPLFAKEANVDERLGNDELLWSLVDGLIEKQRLDDAKKIAQLLWRNYENPLPLLHVLGVRCEYNNFMRLLRTCGEQDKDWPVELLADVDLVDVISSDRKLQDLARTVRREAFTTAQILTNSHVQLSVEQLTEAIKKVLSVTVEPSDSINNFYDSQNQIFELADNTFIFSCHNCVFFVLSKNETIVDDPSSVSFEDEKSQEAFTRHSATMIVDVLSWPNWQLPSQIERAVPAMALELAANNATMIRCAAPGIFTGENYLLLDKERIDKLRSPHPLDGISR